MPVNGGIKLHVCNVVCNCLPTGHTIEGLASKLHARSIHTRRRARVLVLGIGHNAVALTEHKTRV